MADRAKYVVVRELLGERIRELDAGTQIPTETALCEQYGVSRITLRRAVDGLIRKGLLIREQGKGTFVADPPVPERVRETFANRVWGFYRQQTLSGNQVDTTVLRNSICQYAPAATVLEQPAGSDLIRLDRVRRVNGAIQQYSTTWLDAASYPRVLVHDFTEGSLFEFLEQAYQVRLTRNDLLVKLVEAPADVARALEAAVGETLLSLDSTVYAQEDKPVAFGITYIAPEHSEILISLRDSG